MDVDISIGDDSKMPAADNSEGKMTTAFSKCYYLVVISYHLLTTHNNIPADNCPPSNSGRSRGRRGRGSILSNNNSMCRDERLGVGACDRRTLSPTNNMRSRKNRSGGVGDENESSLTNSPNLEKIGMFIYCCAYSLYINYCLYFLFSQLIYHSYQNSTQ